MNDVDGPDKSAGTGGLLAVATSGAVLAAIPPPRTLVAIFLSADNFQEPCGTYSLAAGGSSTDRRTSFAACACSADGASIAVATAHERLIVLARDGTVQHETGAAEAPWRAAAVAGLAFTAGGDLLLLAGNAELFVLRRAQGWAARPLLSATAHHWRARCLALSPDGALAAIAGDGPTLSVWRIRGDDADPACAGGIPGLAPAERAAHRPSEGAQEPSRGPTPRLVARYGARPAGVRGWLRGGAGAARGAWSAALCGGAGGLRVALAAPGLALQLFAGQEPAAAGAPQALQARPLWRSGGGGRGGDVPLPPWAARPATMACEWDAALRLAADERVSADPVHQARWARVEPGPAALRECLDAVADRQWTVRECLARLAPDAAAQAALLDYGLAETERQATLGGRDPGAEAGHGARELGAADGGASGGGNAVRGEWLLLRIRLLQQRERLATLLALHAGAFHPAAFAELRDGPIADAAAALAQVGAVGALLALVGRHPVALAPRLLDAAACLPDTLPLAAYAPLLDWAVEAASGAEEPLPAREADWAEGEDGAAAARELDELGLLTATEPLARAFLGWRPPSLQQVERWVAEHAAGVDARTGQLTRAAELLVHARRLLPGAAALERLDAAAQELQELAAAGGSWALPLREWAELDVASRLRRLVAKTAPPAPPAGTPQQRAALAAVLRRAPAAQRAPAATALLAERAAGEPDLAWCAAVVDAEAQHLQVFDSPAALAEAAAAAAFACSADIDAAAAAAMLASAAGALVAHDAAHALEQAQGAVEGAGLLVGLGLPTAPAALRDVGQEAALALVRTLLARLARSSPPPSDARWTEVWARLRELQAAAFPGLPRAAMLAELVRAQLRCGNWRAARSHLAGRGSSPLAAADAEALVVAAGREYFYAASSLDAPEVAQAQACLTVLPNSAAAAAERDAIAAVLRLREFGVELPPLQFRQVADRMEVLQMALDARQGAYADVSAVDQLAALLGLSGRSAEVRLRRCCAALATGDAEGARALACQLAAEGHAPAWDVASRAAMGLEGSAHAGAGAGGISGELDMLLTFALVHCPEPQLGAILPRWATQPGMPFAASRRALLLGLFASALQALSPESPLAADRLAAAGDEQVLRAWLPPRDAARFVAAAAGAQAAALRERLLLQVAARAGASGAQGAPLLAQAAALGARYGVDAWALRLRFAEAALVGVPDAVDQRADGPSSVTAHSAPGVLAAALALTEECVRMGGAAGTQDAAGAAEQLRQARIFVQRAERAAPGLDAWPFVAPLVAAALAAWAQLLAFAALRQDGAGASDAPALALLRELSMEPRACRPSMWPAWTPPKPADAAAERQLLLFARTAAALMPFIPGLCVALADVADAGAAEALFLRSGPGAALRVADAARAARQPLVTGVEAHALVDAARHYGGPALATTLSLLLPGTSLAETVASALAAGQSQAGLAPDDALLAALLATRLFVGLADAPG
ncbi:hypothetical protein WJX81_006720 [Elliptochloris bilobata]|uniref:Sec39 domain-containing protein n=1 Tax=Elliptochloris bilobata TaxID=381761 RepID=A0AAW1RDT0_9CHLO